LSGSQLKQATIYLLGSCFFLRQKAYPLYHTDQIRLYFRFPLLKNNVLAIYNRP
jgi:hypothetical protein